MGRVNIKELLLYGERLTLECKAAKNALPNAVWPTYSSFCNTVGGVMLLGIDEDLEEPDRSKRFTIKGVRNPAKIIKEFWDTIYSDKVNVNVLKDDDVYEDDVDGAKVVVIIIPQSGYLNKPVYINGNPFKGTFKRNFEGDYHCPESEIRAMIRDANEDGNDGVVLEHYTIDDIDMASVHGYRNRFQSRHPGHVWNSDDDITFLRNFGCFGIDRNTGKEWLTVAGLMMFGKGLPVRERMSQIRLDYVDQTNLLPGSRYSDRLTYDGRWENNLYNYFSIVVPKITFDIKTPFVLKGVEREDDTPVHKAVREAFTNMIIHSDLMITGVYKVVKQDHCLTFSNPGTLKLPLERIYHGGATKARNPRLQNLFRMIGLGDNLGSGFPTILSAWNDEKWKRPDLQEDFDLRQVDLKLWMVSLFPPEAIEYMRHLLGDKFDGLSSDEQAVLVTAYLEEEINSPRIQTLLDKNVLEVGRILFHLTNLGYLVSAGRGRGTTYSVTSAPVSNTNGDLSIINEVPSNTNGDLSNINGPGKLTFRDIERRRQMVLDFCDKEAHSAKEILDYLDVSYQSKNIHRYILVLVEQDRLVPEDPNKKRNVRYMVPKK